MQLLRTIALATAVLGASALSANATTVTGTLSLSDSSPSSSGDIATATSLTIGDLVSTTGLNYFASMSAQNFGSITFSPGTGNSLSFSSGAFGAFDSTSITQVTNISGFRSFHVLGNWSSGTWGSGGSGAASFDISFTQTGGPNTSISDSGTFSIPPTTTSAVPELSTWAMMGLGFIGLGLVGFRRRDARMAA
jgi:hypothetical protein